MSNQQWQEDQSLGAKIEERLRQEDKELCEHIEVLKDFAHKHAHDAHVHVAANAVERWLERKK